MVGNLQAVPESLKGSIAFDPKSGSVFIDKRAAGNPLLLTWRERNLAKGVRLRIVPVEPDEVARLRASGMRPADDVDEDMIVRGNAIDLIKEAAAYGASDIHLMMRGTYTEIQIVVKGGLRVLMRRSHKEGADLTRAIYQGIAKTRDGTFNPLDFQNAQIPGDELPAETGLTSIRIIRGPCYPQMLDGAFMTLRLQYSSMPKTNPGLRPLPLPRRPDSVFRLQEMGFTAGQVARLQRLMDAPNGVVIFTGPTGSGKTTSMYEALKEIARQRPYRRLVTVEDPVEYPMDWAVQMAVTGARNDAETGAAFSDRLRVALRMAPNIILVGELRGPDVAAAALEAAVTGHQVWTTMHVTDPFLFVDRLELMDGVRLHRRVTCDHQIVRGVVAQRLLPRLCPHCSQLLRDAPDALSAEIVAALETWGDIDKVRVQGEGCDHCGQDGSIGRFAVVEIVILSSPIMRDIIESGSEVARNNYRTRPDADPSMLEAAIMHALSGMVDPRAVEECVDLVAQRPAHV
jgi:type II secretory ATPase GspE/PulE/Tfp pilus assembly ATPase PilB-like protein